MIMKKLALFALSVVASTAFAAGEIVIGGTSNQTANFTGAAVTNYANGGDSSAFQNMASNSGMVTIGGTSNQTVNMTGGIASNLANEDAVAQQNVSSNVGDKDKITIGGTSNQNASISNSALTNRANVHTVAQQSVTSNVGNVDIGGVSNQSASITLSAITNEAYGYGALAVQNIASNHSCNAFTCPKAEYRY